MDKCKLVAPGWRRWGNLEKGRLWARREEDEFQISSVAMGVTPGDLVLDGLQTVKAAEPRRPPGPSCWGSALYGAGVPVGGKDRRAEGPTGRRRWPVKLFRVFV